MHMYYNSKTVYKMKAPSLLFLKQSNKHVFEITST